MLKFYENEYGFIKMEELRITSEFKYCTLTCTLVRGGNKRSTLQNGLVPQVRGEDFLSIVDSIKILLPLKRRV